MTATLAAPAPIAVPLSPLVGEALVARVKELDGATKSELVRACGYLSLKKDGTERLNYTAFYEALLEAKGMDFCPKERQKPGRNLSFQAKVQFNGNLMVGKSYVRMLGFEPGDSFEIRLSKKAISMVPITSGAD